MRKATGVILVGLLLGGGVSGCGSSLTGTNAAASAPTVSASVVYRRAERALARVHSFAASERVLIAHRPTITGTMRLDGPGRIESTTRFSDFAVTSRIVGGSLYASESLTGSAADEATSEGEPTSTPWYGLRTVGVVSKLAALGSPRRYAACLFPREPARRLTVTGTGLVQGQPVDVLRVRQGKVAGTLTLKVAANPPYLPLVISRTGGSSQIGPLTKAVSSYSGCQSTSLSFLRFDRRYIQHFHIPTPLPKVRLSAMTLSGYDVPQFRAPRHAHRVPLTPELAHLLGAG